MANNIITVKDLRVWFPVRRGFIESILSEEQRYVKAVDGISFNIREREIFCLVGESGCGKTTTGKAILRLVEPTGGEVTYYGPGKDELLEEIAASATSRRRAGAARVQVANPERWDEFVEVKNIVNLERARASLSDDKIDEILKKSKIKMEEGDELVLDDVRSEEDKKALKPFTSQVKTNWITMATVPNEKKDQVLKDAGINVRILSKPHMKAMRQKLQIIFQDPYESLNPKQSVYDIIAEPLVVNSIGANEAEREAKVTKALEDAGLRPPKAFMWRYPHEVSGGQRQRVGVAGALVLDPDFLVADEPVSMLDVSIRSEILKLMLDLREKKGLSFLFITHDLGVAYVFSDRIGIMYLGKIVELGPTEKVIKNPQHPYTKALISVVPTPDPKDRTDKIILKGERPDPSNIPPGCRFHPRCPFMMDICKTEEPKPVFISEGHWVSCHLQKVGQSLEQATEETGGAS
ncbi:MAG: ABC transporter ATP-binding protein [Methanobacteriota archaeon]|nr:MAG: ABC transporter ATP-binding protein [Euryarchaeota archaeon]